MAIGEALEKARSVINENSVLEQPVDVREIAANYGIDVREAEFPEEFKRTILGYITPKDDKETATIVLNKADSEESKLFTIAHELGHWILHKQQILKDPDKSILFRTPLGSPDKDSMEKEADAFAAELLVPTEFMEKIGTDKPVEELAKQFGVSKEVIGYHKKVVSEYENTRDQSKPR